MTKVAKPKTTLKAETKGFPLLETTVINLIVLVFMISCFHTLCVLNRFVDAIFFEYILVSKVIAMSMVCNEEEIRNTAHKTSSIIIFNQLRVTLLQIYYKCFNNIHQ